jgi:hypothetical protein
MLGPDPLGGLQALDRVRGRHPHVDDRHIRAVLGHELDQRLAVAGLRHDLDPGRLEHVRDPLSDQDRVVGEDRANLLVKLGWECLPDAGWRGQALDDISPISASRAAPGAVSRVLSASRV